MEEGWGGWEDAVRTWALLAFGGAAFLSGYDELVKKIALNQPVAPHISSLMVSIHVCPPNISVVSTSLQLQAATLVHTPPSHLYPDHTALGVGASLSRCPVFPCRLFLAAGPFF